jgi:MoaA/NifB/PqqE/SkfB family radical SAM enzyme/transcriptional regulator with XRE-family HTH domain
MPPSAAIRSTPVNFVELELTSGCEPPCRRCRSYNGSVHGVDTMTAGHWKQTIDSAAASGVEVIQFAGSKSAVFPDLVEHALSAGVKVDVYSPLVHVSDGMWELFALRAVSLGICWYAADPLQHTEITGTEGSWYQARQNTVKALERGLLPRAEVVTVIDGPSISQARAELNRLGIGAIIIDRARSAFLAAKDRPATLEDLCGGYGDGRAGVTWDGAVVPCVVLGRHLVAGNVKDTPFAEILTSQQWADILALIPSDQPCQGCTRADSFACALTLSHARGWKIRELDAVPGEFGRSDHSSHLAVAEVSSMTAQEDLPASGRRFRRQLGRELMALRTLAGLIQRDMRDKVGVSQTFVSRIENGEAAPSKEELTAWVKAAGAQDRLDNFLALNEIAHDASAGAGIVRTFTLVGDYGGDSYVRVLTRQAELLITSPASVERYRALRRQHRPDHAPSRERASRVNAPSRPGPRAPR